MVVTILYPMVRRLGAAACVAFAAAAVLGAATLQAPDPQVRARIDAFIGALGSGDAAKYEAMASENFSPEFLAARTPDDRSRFVQRLAGDFGRLSVGRVTTEDGEHFALRVTGSTGLEGEVRLALESTAPHRITSIAVEVGRRAGDGPSAVPPPPIAANMNAADLSRGLDQYFAPLAAADTFAGTVLVARNGSPVYQHAFGPANRETKTPAAVTTRFNLGSINKIFTKTAIAQLIALGKLARTDTIGKLLPDYPNPQARPATVDQLLQHQAGIADFFGPAFEAAPKTNFRSNADYYRFVSPQPLLFEPGTKRQYCNGCYVVLGAIIEKVSGLRYEDYVAGHVFKPAGMKTAGFFHSDRLPPDVAVGYTRRAPGSDASIRPSTALHGAAGSAAGGAYASVADLLAFDNALRERRLLDAKMTAWVLGGGEDTSGRAQGGLGIAGGAPGVNAVLESDGTWTVVVLANLDPPAAEQLGVAIHRQLVK